MGLYIETQKSQILTVGLKNRGQFCDFNEESSWKITVWAGIKQLCIGILNIGRWDIVGQAGFRGLYAGLTGSGSGCRWFSWWGRAAVWTCWLYCRCLCDTLAEAGVGFCWAEIGLCCGCYWFDHWWWLKGWTGSNDFGPRVVADCWFLLYGLD